MIEDYYKIIGVNEECGIWWIKKAYRNLAFLHHPDRATAAEDMMKKSMKPTLSFQIQRNGKEYDTMSKDMDRRRENSSDKHTLIRISSEIPDISQILEEFSRVFGLVSLKIYSAG